MASVGDRRRTECSPAGHVGREPETGQAAFPLLAAPLQLRGRTLRNRLVMAPMSVCYGDRDGRATQATIEHYARRAAGGAAMVITENIAVSEAGRQMPRQLLASGERFLPGLSELAAAIKDQGAIAIAQIVHSGRYAGPWDEYAARRRLAPSTVEFELRPGERVVPSEMNDEEIETALAEFGAAAALIRRAGFDGIEIHAAQGFLISSFQSPLMNRRIDRYGADRNLFAHRVVAAVTEAAGEGLLVGYHLMSDEMMPGGWSPVDAAEFVADLDPRVDFVVPIPTTFESLRAKISAGVLDATAYSPEVARRIAVATTIPVFANGGLGRGRDAETVLAAGDVQAILVGKAMLSDPDLAAKVLRGDESAVITCNCNPPRCLQTQLDGVICKAWPDAVSRHGYWGFEQGEFCKGRETKKEEAK